MEKKDCKIGMFVSVMQNTSSLSKNRSKTKRIGKITGIYEDYANLLLFESNAKEIDWTNNNEDIVIKRKLYNESYKFPEICKIERNIINIIDDNG